MAKRAFLIVLDSVGIGSAPDSGEFGDAGADTLGSLVRSGKLSVPNLQSLGLYNITGTSFAEPIAAPQGSFGRLREASRGKDTTIGHWEIAGLVSHSPLPVFPQGFPQPLLEEFSRRTGRGVLCNLPYSGTEVIEKYGQQQLDTGDLIVYTSADSVFQIAAHEEAIGLDELYRCCTIARELLTGEYGVGRVIARPFIGQAPNFKRTANRRDYSLLPPRPTMLNFLSDAGLDCLGVGKIYDIFAGSGLKEKMATHSNNEGMQLTLRLAGQPFHGLCFVNLVDFDMVYGHRRDIAGYTQALNEFDVQLGSLLAQLGQEDMLLITADHGCDPGYTGTDHTREYVPLLVAGPGLRKGVNLGDRATFADIAATVLEYLGVQGQTDGSSFLNSIMR